MIKFDLVVGVKSSARAAKQRDSEHNNLLLCQFSSSRASDGGKSMIYLLYVAWVAIVLSHSLLSLPPENIGAAQIGVCCSKL